MGPRTYTVAGAPGVTDDCSKAYRAGDWWVDSSNTDLYRLRDGAIGAAVWDFVPNGLATEEAFLDGVAAGTATASKAVVLGASKEIATITSATITTLTSTTVNATTVDATTLEIGNVAVTATAAEVNYNDITTLGTLAASKTWTSDASLDTVMPTGGLLTVQSGGAVTFNSGSTLTVNGSLVYDSSSTAVESAEHGAGSIGTAVAPATYRWIENGVIITQIKFDLTGLASVATANDVIGLAAGGVAYIGRNVVATNGVIFKAELSCLETPLTGDNDVNVVTNASAALVYDDAGGTTYISNSGDLLAGQTIQNLVPAIPANDYYYLTAGTGDTAGTYTAGMYLLTLYGHAAL